MGTTRTRPQAVFSLQRRHKSQEISNASVVFRRPHPTAQVENQRQVETGEEGEKAARRFCPYEPRYWELGFLVLLKLGKYEKLNAVA